jgi:hypothetical protein
MSSIRQCLAMTLGVIALALFLVAIGMPGGVVFALAPVAICLSMVLLMARGDRVEEGLRRFNASSDTRGQEGHATPEERPGAESTLA